MAFLLLQLNFLMWNMLEGKHKIQLEVINYSFPFSSTFYTLKDDLKEYIPANYLKHAHTVLTLMTLMPVHTGPQQIKYGKLCQNYIAQPSMVVCWIKQVVFKICGIVKIPRCLTDLEHITSLHRTSLPPVYCIPQCKALIWSTHGCLFGFIFLFYKKILC